MKQCPPPFFSPLPLSSVMTRALMERPLWGWHSNADIWIMSVYQRENGPPAFVVPPSVRAGSPLAGTQAGEFVFNHACTSSPHTHTHTHTPTTAHRNPEGAILDGFVKVRESVETVYTKNFNGFYFKRLQRKSHQIVTTNIKSLIVTNPPDCTASLSAWLISSRGQARTPFSAAKMLNPITLHVNLQEASYT